MNSMQAFYNKIMVNGETRYPRGLETIGLMNQSFTFFPGQVFRHPHGNTAIGFVELLQFIAGTFSIEPFKVVAPKARLDLFTEQSAYGPRTAGQLDRVIEELSSDRDTRRSVMTIINDEDTPETMPCTLSAQFQVRENLLMTTWTMRSSDLVWGLPTDIVQFGGISQVVANCLNIACAGLDVINIGNAHVYTSTALERGGGYNLVGTFHVPSFSTIAIYRHWSRMALKDITSGARSVKDVFPITHSKGV